MQSASARSASAAAAATDSQSQTTQTQKHPAAVPPLPSPWLRRVEHALLLLPLLMMAIEAAFQMDASTMQCAALDAAAQKVALMAPSTPPVQRWLHRYLHAYQWIKCKEGLGTAAALAAMTAMAAIICNSPEPDNTHARRGASSGLLMGCLSVPLVLLAQLFLHAHLDVTVPLSLLLWLSLCCSAMALASVHFGCGGVSDPRGPGLCEVITAAILSQIGMVVQDVMTFSDTLVVCFFFVYILHFLLHRLPFSFSSGEAVTVATLLSLLLTHASFSLLAHLLWLRGPKSLLLGKLASWAERAMVLDISAASDASRSLQQQPADPEHLAPVRFYAACGSLIVGVIVLGLLWFRPFLLPFKRAQSRARKQQQQQLQQHGAHTELRPLLAPIATLPDQGAHRDEDEAEQTDAPLSRDSDRDVTPVTTAPEESDGEHKQGQMTHRKKAAAAVASSSSGAASRLASSRSTRLAPLPLRSRAGDSRKDSLGGPVPRASASPAPKPWSVRSLHLWMLAIIFLVVYPYIFVEMGCEPFGFVLHFLLSVAPSDEEFYARQRRLRAMGAPMDPRAMPPSIALRAGSGGRLRLGSVELDTGLLTHSVRFTILLCWCAIMALGVFLCAPAGTARRSRKALHSTAAEPGTPPASARALPVSPSSIRVAPAATLPASSSLPSNVDALALDPALDESVAATAAAAITSGEQGGGLLSQLPNILVRKYYHFLAVAMFLPSILLEPGLVCLSFAVALSVFALMEYIRVARLPPFGERMHRFMTSYLDVRDSGAVILTHTYLLIGCALPLWLHMHVLAADEPQILQSAYASRAAFAQALQDAPSRGGGVDGGHSAQARYALPNPLLVWNMQMYLPALAGVLILGIGDSMASVVGVWAGRHRWFGSKRTVEGTVAAIVCIFVSTFGCLLVMEAINQTAFQGKLHIQEPSWGSFLIATTLTCLLEAVTSQIDNLFLPLYYYTCMIIMFNW